MLTSLRMSRRRLATVAVGVSGGVDSSVAALLLKQQGHDVIGVHMTNWDAQEEISERELSCQEQEKRDAQEVCRTLGIGFHQVNFVREYWHLVFEPFLQAYRDGLTPNPDIACNRFIKFDHFHQHALSLGADYVATGHYARLRREPSGLVQMLKAVDHEKDQSYFLSHVAQAPLQRALFPLGELPKAEVRRMASEARMHVALKKDSVGICFVGKRRFGEFIRNYIPCTSGPFVDVESGCQVGEHRGHVLHTPGSKARIGGLAEQPDRKKWYVVGKSAELNTVYVALGKDHPALLTQNVLTEAPNWIAGAPPAGMRDGDGGGSGKGARAAAVAGGAQAEPEARSVQDGVLRCEARWRYQGQLGACEVRSVGEGLRVTFDAPMQHAAEQQALVLYDGDVCLGGANIRRRIQALSPLEGIQVSG